MRVFGEGDKLLNELYRLRSMTNIKEKDKFQLNYPVVDELMTLLATAIKEREEPF